jgi:hypothetical protein
MLHQILEDIIKNYRYTIKRIAKHTGLSEKTIRLIKSKKINHPRNQTTLKLLNLYFALQYRKTLLDQKSLAYFDNYYLNTLKQQNKHGSSKLKIEEPSATYSIDFNAYKKFKFPPVADKDFAEIHQSINTKHFLL